MQSYPLIEHNVILRIKSYSIPSISIVTAKSRSLIHRCFKMLKIFKNQSLGQLLSSL